MLRTAQRYRAGGGGNGMRGEVRLQRVLVVGDVMLGPGRGGGTGQVYNSKKVLIFKKQGVTRTQNCMPKQITRMGLWQMNRKSAVKKSKEAERGCQSSCV
jgi:hypothetical protein